MIVEPCTPAFAREFAADGRRDGLLFLDAAEHFRVVRDGETVAVFAMWQRGRGRWVMKSDYVPPALRGQGIYDFIFRWRLDELRRRGAVSIEGTFTRHSIGTARRYGGIVRKQYRDYATLAFPVSA